jgi:drug/metabolite transporter (DMT)-like permease
MDSVRAVRRISVVDLMLLLTVLLWALNFTVTKYAIEHGFHPLAYSTIRYAFGAAIFAGITYRREGTFEVRRRDVALLAGAAAVGIWLNQVSYVYALSFTTATTVALVLGATPIFAALIARAVGLERLSRRFWVASAVSFAGVALIAAGGGGGGVSANVKGVGLAIATAATWAAYSVAVAPLMRRYSPYRISAIVLVLGWIPLFITGAKQLAEQQFDLGWLTWLCLVYGVLGPLVLTNVLWFKSVDRVGPSHATLFANIQPFFAAIFAVILLSEPLGALQIAGGLAVLVGIAISRIPGVQVRRRRTAPVDAAPGDMPPAAVAVRDGRSHPGEGVGASDHRGDGTR